MSEIKIKSGGNAVLVGTLVPVGSRDEKDEIKGVSHFLEHMMFKGTKTRSKNDITRTAEQYGAQFNAWTSEEHTFYYMTIGKKYRDLAREIIDDMVHNSVLPAEEVDNERQVILQELQMYADNPQSATFQEAQRVVFEKGSGLHIPIIGTKETLAGITRDTLARYYEKNYQKMVKVEVGDVEDLRNKVILPRKFQKESLDFSRADHIVSRQGIQQANMVVTGLIHKESTEDNHRLGLFSTVMNGFQGRLFQTVREANHLVYHCGFYAQTLSCGTVQYWVYAALNADKISKARELILQELTRPVSQEEYDFAKSKALGEHELYIDSKANIGKIVIDSVVNNENYDDLLVDYVNINVSLSQLNDFARRANFVNSKLVAVVPA